MQAILPGSSLEADTGGNESGPELFGMLVLKDSLVSTGVHLLRQVR
jgi:hypothetical protein